MATTQIGIFSVSGAALATAVQAWISTVAVTNISGLYFVPIQDGQVLAIGVS